MLGPHGRYLGHAREGSVAACQRLSWTGSTIIQRIETRIGRHVLYANKDRSSRNRWPLALV